MNMDPHSLELERALLGGIMQDPQQGFKVAREYVRAESFHAKLHGSLFALMEKITERGLQPDFGTLVDSLQASGNLDKAGGIDGLVNILNAAVSSAQVETHALRISELFLMRQIIHVCSSTIQNAASGISPPEDVLTGLRQAVANQLHGTGSFELETMATLMDEYSAGMAARWEEWLRSGKTADMTPGFKTGLVNLDQYIRLGFEELIIIAARPSVGKTALALQFAADMAIDGGIPVAFFSLEMSRDAIAERLLALRSFRFGGGFMSCIPGDRIRRSDFSDEEAKFLGEIKGQIRESPLLLDSVPQLDIEVLKSKARRAVKRQGARIIFMDYLQLGSSGSQQARSNRVQEVSEISKGLKALARELKVPVVALSQLRRPMGNSKNSRPKLEDLKESGAIEQDADRVIFIHSNESPEDRLQTTELHPCTLIIAKNRNSPVGDARVLFHAPSNRYLDQASNQQPSHRKQNAKQEDLGPPLDWPPD